MKIPPVNISLACCGIVRSKDQKILITKRHSQLSYPNAWVLAGGRVDQGETLIDATLREIHEEVGIDIKLLENYESKLVLLYEAFNGPGRSGKHTHYLISYYLFDLEVDAQEIEVVVQPNEVSDYKWVDTIEFKEFIAKGLELIEQGDTYSGKGELVGLHPNKDGTGIAEGSFNAIKSILGFV